MNTNAINVDAESEAERADARQQFAKLMQIRARLIPHQDDPETLCELHSIDGQLSKIRQLLAKGA